MRLTIPTTAIVAIMCVVTPSTLAAQSAEQLIERLEQNTVPHTSQYSGSFIIEDRFGERTSAFDSYNRGESDALIEFTSAAERGQKILRTADELYLYFPDANEIIRLRGAALRESLLGSDVSYEDLTGNRGYLDSYTATIIGTEAINDIDTTIVELNAITADIAYPKQRLWIDNTRFVLIKSEQFALSGRLLKETAFIAHETIGDTIFPTHIEISDSLKRNSKTTIKLSDISINPSLPAGIFSLSELSF